MILLQHKHLNLQACAHAHTHTHTRRACTPQQVYLYLTSVFLARCVIPLPLLAQQPECCHGHRDSHAHTHRPLRVLLSQPRTARPAAERAHGARLPADGVLQPAESTQMARAVSLPPPQDSPKSADVRVVHVLPYAVYLSPHVGCSGKTSRSRTPAPARALYSPRPRGDFFHFLSSQLEPGIIPSLSTPLSLSKSQLKPEPEHAFQRLCSSPQRTASEH